MIVHFILHLPFNFFPFVASYRKRHYVQWYNFCYTITENVLYVYVFCGLYSQSAGLADKISPGACSQADFNG